MKHLYALPVALALLVAATLTTACGESAKEKAAREKIDSLQTENNQKDLSNEDLRQFIGEIADGLDNISASEKELYIKNGQREGQLTRKEMQTRVDKLRDILNTNRARIAELEKKLAGQTGSAKQLQTIVSALRQQLEEKEKEIEQLKADLEEGKKNIEQLNEQVSDLGEKNTAQAQTIEQQEGTISKQDAQMHTAYVKTGTKAELKQLGLLKGSKVVYAGVNLDNFRAIDIREVKTFSLSKKAKILTPAPADSYTLTKDGDKQTLTINNPDRFWSMSRCLIIME